MARPSLFILARLLLSFGEKGREERRAVNGI
jgi:hypothetical protein